MKGRGAKNDERLARGARHVAYELGMFRLCLGTLQQGQGIDVVHLECFLTHTRNLIEFFFDGAPKGCMLPKDFGAPPGRDQDRAIAAVRDELSQLVAHLTWARVDEHELKKENWTRERLDGIASRIREKAAAFFVAIPETSRPWFEDEWFSNEWERWTNSTDKRSPLAS